MEDLQEEEKRWEADEAGLFSDASSSAASPNKNAVGSELSHNLVNPLDAAANEAERQFLLQHYQQFILVRQKVALARQYYDAVSVERNDLDLQFNGFLGSSRSSSFLSDDEYDAQRKKLASLKVTATALLWAALQEEHAVEQQMPPAVLAAVAAATTTTTTPGANYHYNQDSADSSPHSCSSEQQAVL